ncbi:MAG: NAD-dependent epimerase/dehydratase family protein [Myxococcota bacterium]
MRVLVTGGAGFIGSHVVEALVARGDEVVVVDDLSTGHRSNLAAVASSITFLQADIGAGLLGHLEGDFDGVVHLAAQVSVVRSVAEPLVDVRTNGAGLVHVLEAARRHGKAKVVYASSAAVYGEAPPPVDEDAPCRPLSPYGIHKHAGEHWLAFYESVHGVPGASLRFFNVYGPRQDPSSPYSGVISIFSKLAKAGERLMLHGDGEQSRDFVFVADVVTAVLAALDDRSSAPPVNVGTGTATSVRFLAETLINLAGQGELAFGPPRAGDIRHSRAKVERLRTRYGLEAKTPLEEGLAALLPSV